MSIKYMTCVWEKSKQEGTCLLLLLALADHANDAGVCWPGITHLSHKIRRTKRQTKRLIQQLIASGELEVAEGVGRGHTNLYKILLDPYENGDADDTISDEKKVTSRAKKVTPTTKKVTSEAVKGDTAMSPEPSLTVKEPSGNLSPAGAENPPEPNILPPTDNPNSITNRQNGSGDEHQGGNASTGDYGGDLLRHANGGESWTVPAEAGGADSFRDSLIDWFCRFIGIPAFSLSEKKRGQWAAAFRKMAADWDVGADALISCIQAMPKSEFGFKSYSTPYQDSFQNDLFVLISRYKGGQPLVEESPRASPSRKQRHGQRREYEPCTEAEQQAM